MNQKTRREFITSVFSIVGSGIIISGTGLLATSCETQEDLTGAGGIEKININDFPELQTAGGAKSMTFSKKGTVLIIRQTDNSFSTFSAICTHQGCNVNPPETGSNRMECFCHGSVFSSVDGSPLQGPSDGSKITSLRKYQNKFDSTTGILEIYF